MNAAGHSGPDQRPPSLLLALTEIPRTALDMSGLAASFVPLLAASARGDGHPVLVIPGLIAGDGSTLILRAFLRQLGYDVRGWSLGRNFGPRAIGPSGERLEARLAEMVEETGKRVSLIGWSLGGLMARILAHRRPSSIRQVITLGSGFAGPARATNAWRLYEAVAKQAVDHRHSRSQLEESASPLPVPSTAVYSREDGIVAWQNCREEPSRNSESIRVWGSHCGFGFNQAVYYLIADRLAQPDGQWRAFERGRSCRAIYPDA